nr:hypothetical protein [Bacteroides acidifaciens]
MAHSPESLDCGELFPVLLGFLVANQLIIVAHGELEVVGIHLSAVHCRGEHEIL